MPSRSARCLWAGEWGRSKRTFAQLPEGRLKIDVHTGTCEHDSVGVVKTYIGPEIAAWFSHRLAEHRIDPTEVRKCATDGSIDPIDAFEAQTWNYLPLAM